MDLKTVWLDLKNTLHVLFKTPHISKQDSCQVDVVSHTLVWNRPVLVDGESQSEEENPIFSLPLEAKPEYEWLTKDYDIRLTVQRMKYTHRYWRATMTVDCQSITPAFPLDNPNLAEFFPCRLPFTLSFGSIVLAGIASSPSDIENPFQQVTCAGDSESQTIISHFRWPTNVPAGTVYTFANDHIRLALRDHHTQAFCTVQARPMSHKQTTRTPEVNFACSWLAMQVSRAASKLLALPMTATLAGSPDVIQVVSRDCPFHANFTRLTAASTVIATCFQHTTFTESKNRVFEMASFSPDVVEAFLHFCSYGTVPPCIEAVLVDLAKLSHQYGVNRLLLICEVFLIREVYSTNLKRLGELAGVAVKLELPLLLTAFEIVLRERQLNWWTCTRAVPGKIGPWAGIMDRLPGFEAARFRALTVLDSLDQSDDGTVIHPDTTDIEI